MADLDFLCSFIVSLTIDAMCRRNIRYPQFFIHFPESKFIYKRFQVYELIVRGFCKEAVELFNINFGKVMGLDEFLYTKQHFLVLFSNIELARKIIIEKLKEIKNEFKQKLFDNLSAIFHDDYTLTNMKNTDNLELPPCEENDIKYRLFYSEIEISFSIIKVKRDKEYQSSNLVLFDKEIEEMQNYNDDVFNLSHNSDKKNDCDLYNNNNKNDDENGNSEDKKQLGENNSIDFVKDNSSCNNNFYITDIAKFYNNSKQKDNKFYKYIYESNDYNNIVFIYNTIGHRESIVLDELAVNIEILIIGRNVRNSILSNSFYNLTFPSTQVREICQGEEYNKFYLKKNYSYFLSHFSPQFLNKERIDKFIFRRFRSYVQFCLLELDIITDIKKSIAINNNINKTNGKSNKKTINKTNNNITKTILTNNKDNKDNLFNIYKLDKYRNKYVYNKAKVDSIIRNKKTNDYKNDNNNSSNKLIDSSYYDFGVKFVTHPYLPPFIIKDENINFKAYSLKYLIWLFKDPFIYDIYSQFSEYYSSLLSNLLIETYDVKNKESSIIKKLEYYITNLNKIYYKIDLPKPMNEAETKNLHITSIKNDNENNNNNNIKQSSSSLVVSTFYSQYQDNNIKDIINIDESNNLHDMSELNEFNYFNSHSNFNIDLYNIDETTETKINMLKSDDCLSYMDYYK